MEFSYSLLTRSLRINHENLRSRDTKLVAEIDAVVAEKAAQQSGVPVGQITPPPIFTPYKLRDMVLDNRIMVSPMCMYSATDGIVGDWHLVHLGSRAMGGAGLIMTECTAVTAEGRITLGCSGMYSDDHIKAWRRVVDFVHKNSFAKIGMQIGHAGRKASTRLQWEGGEKEKIPSKGDNWPGMAASPIPYTEENQTPKEIDRKDMDCLIADYVAAANRAQEAGFDMLELHCAHGYLLNTFLSPKTNHRRMHMAVV